MCDHRNKTTNLDGDTVCGDCHKVLSEFKLESYSLVTEDQLVDKNCRIKDENSGGVVHLRSEEH